MIRTWQLQEAKNRLSEVIESAMSSGPQVITRRGVEVAIVVSSAEYRKLIASRGHLSAFFSDSPLAEADLDLARDESGLRADVEL
jgi:antitoxin Phd